MKPRLVFWLLALLGAHAAVAASPSEAALTPAPGFVATHAAVLEKLFGALDPARPGLAPAFAAWRAGQRPEACRELLRYFHDRPPLPHEVLAGWNSPDPPAPAPAEAAALLRGEVTLQSVTAPLRRRADGAPDWTWAGPRNDPEWTWMLNRHGWFPALAAAWHQSGDSRYAATVAAQLADWVDACPYPGRRTFSPAWRPLEAARRVLGSWPQTFEALRDAPDFNPAARLLLLASLPDHADALSEHASVWGGNHLLTEKLALAKLAVVWPEFRDAPAWLHESAQEVSRELLDQTYPDGAFKELTNLYQSVILVDAQNFLTLMAASGHAAEADAVRPRVLAMWRYFAGVTKPDGFGPLTNASDEVNNFSLLLGADGVTPAVPGLDPAELALARNRPPRSQFFPWAGAAVMRGGTGASAQWALFSAGPYGTSHQHDGHLDLALFAGGRDLLVDAGRYTYQPGPWFDYFKGPRSNNVLLLDGRGAEPPPNAALGQPLPVTARLTPGWDYFAATATFAADPWTGRGGACWTRGVLYLHGIGWIVIDELNAFGPVTVTALWHFHPGLTVEAGDGGLNARADGQSVLTLRELLHPDWHTALLRGVEQPIPAGWYAPHYNVKLPATQAELTTRLTHPTRYVWQLSPAGNGDWRVTCTTDASGNLDLTTTIPGSTPQSLQFHFGSAILPGPQ